MQSVALRRNRVTYAVSLAAVIVLGLASRRYPGLLPHALGKYPGDALWALMVFLILGIIRPSSSTGSLALTALGVACLDEASQLYQAPWINAVRATTLGHLALGSAFSWMDIVAYTVGVMIGSAVELGVGRRRLTRAHAASPCS
jgi:hypothetical protein